MFELTLPAELYVHIGEHEFVAEVKHVVAWLESRNKQELVDCGWAPDDYHHLNMLRDAQVAALKEQVDELRQKLAEARDQADKDPTVAYLVCPDCEGAGCHRCDPGEAK